MDVAAAQAGFVAVQGVLLALRVKLRGDRAQGLAARRQDLSKRGSASASLDPGGVAEQCCEVGPAAAVLATVLA
jgi:hypothetical protein